jgi:hypothetical protein
MKRKTISRPSYLKKTRRESLRHSSKRMTSSLMQNSNPSKTKTKTNCG